MSVLNRSAVPKVTHPLDTDILPQLILLTIEFHFKIFDIMCLVVNLRQIILLGNHSVADVACSNCQPKAMPYRFLLFSTGFGVKVFVGRTLGWVPLRPFNNFSVQFRSPEHMGIPMKTTLIQSSSAHKSPVLDLQSCAYLVVSPTLNSSFLFKRMQTKPERGIPLRS